MQLLKIVLPIAVDLQKVRERAKNTKKKSIGHEHQRLTLFLRPLMMFTIALPARLSQIAANENVHGRS